MRVVVVTEWTPTPENRGGISALHYSIIKYRPLSVEVKVFTYNLNHISKEELKEISKQLNAEICVISGPNKWYNCFGRKWRGRYELYIKKYPPSSSFYNKDLVKLFDREQCDFFFLYPRAMYALAAKMPTKSFVISGPDCESFNRSRRFSSPFRLNSRKMITEDFFYILKYRNMEKIWGAKNVWVHFVGMADYKFYSDVSGNRNAHFLLHPFVKYKDKIIDFVTPQKLKVIIPGSYNMYYNVDVDKMLPELIGHKDILLKHFEFTFLGKCWTPIDKRLKEAGFDCEFKTWVDDYAEELVLYDIQITPISFGTGTKGKVLDAMVNGLLVVGSDYALENICVRDMDSCVRYRDASQIASILISVANHRERYQTIAEKGRAQVLKYHDPTRISKRFFDIYYRELTGKRLIL
jgi:glycosyltransferase involved in cell wall biosynthesis